MNGATAPTHFPALLEFLRPGDLLGGRLSGEMLAVTAKIGEVSRPSPRVRARPHAHVAANFGNFRQLQAPRRSTARQPHQRLVQRLQEPRAVGLGERRGAARHSRAGVVVRGLKKLRINVEQLLDLPFLPNAARRIDRLARPTCGAGSGRRGIHHSQPGRSACCWRA